MTSETVRGEIRLTGFEFETLAHQHLNQIFPTVASGTQLESENLPSILVDIFARSTNGRILLFELKSFKQGKKLPYSVYPSIANLQKSVSTVSKGKPPVVVLVTNASLDSDARSLFTDAKIPVINLGKDVNETFSNLKREFERLSIEVTELSGDAPVYLTSSVILPNTETLSISLVSVHTLERLEEYQSDLGIANLLIGVFIGVAGGVISNILTNEVMSMTKTSIILLTICLLLLVSSAFWSIRIRNRIAKLKNTLLQRQSSEIKFPLGE